jgi:hypothetical protein
LGDPSKLEAEVALAMPELGVSFVGGVFFTVEGLGVCTGMGEPLAPLELEGSDARGAILAAFGLEGFSALGASSPILHGGVVLNVLWCSAQVAESVPIKIEGIHVKELPR